MGFGTSKCCKQSNVEVDQPVYDAPVPCALEETVEGLPSHQRTEESVCQQNAWLRTSKCCKGSNVEVDQPVYDAPVLCALEETVEGAPLRLFLSHQQTEESVRQRHAWLPMEAASVKASVPPFNMRLHVALPSETVGLNVATFGVRLPRVIMGLFESQDIIELAEKLKIPIPRYALDSFVQKKMKKVLDFVQEVRKSYCTDDESMAAADKLENFTKEFQTLNDEIIQGPHQFQEFVERHVPKGWEDRLHFDDVLCGNFGFEKSIAHKLRATQITIPNTDKDAPAHSTELVTLEHHAVRWLTKAFRGYGPVGCLTDVVNLVYAMLGFEQPARASEKDAINAVEQLQERLRQRDFAGLWIPTHLVHDAESDDALTWLLLEHILREGDMKLQVLIQLPQEQQFDEIARFLRCHHPSARIFYDKDSTNGKAVGNTWRRMLM